MSGVSAAASVDDLYRRAIEEPATVDDRALEEWLQEVAEVVDRDREQLKILKRAVRTARKLSTYWMERDGGGLPDWRNGVDEAQGGRGWQHQLDLVRLELDRQPSAEAFAELKERHRAVHFTEWMEGVTFEEWTP